MTFIINKYNKRSCRSVEQLLYTTEVQHLLLFIQKEKQPILREIKAAFPNHDHLANIIEQLIHLNIIRRENRRYYCHYPIITNKEWDKTSQKISSFIQTICNEKEELSSEVYAYLLMTLCHHLQQNCLEHFPLLCQGTQPLSIIKCFEGKREQWLEIGTLTNENDSLLDYFDDMAVGSIQPQHQHIATLIGDVNAEFFLHHCLTKLKRAQRRGRLVEDYNIFNDCLEQLHYLEDGKLNIPILTKEDIALIDDKMSFYNDELLSVSQELSEIEQLLLIQQLIQLIPKPFSRMIIKQ